MSYLRAEEILPKELLEAVQQYVNGQSVYIPAKEKSDWGSGTDTKQILSFRNRDIFENDSEMSQKIYNFFANSFLGKRMLRINESKIYREKNFQLAINAGYYNKQDFVNLIYSMAGCLTLSDSLQKLKELQKTNV